MKRVFFGTVMIVVLSFFGFYACNDAEEVHTSTSENPEIKQNFLRSQSTYYTRSDLQTKSPDEIRAIFNSISPQNRYDLFLDKFDHCLTLSPSSSQAIIINDVINEMSVNAYSWGSAEHLDFINVYLPSKLADLQQNFSDQEGLNVFYHLYDINSLGGVPNADGDDDAGDCGCNRGSTFGGCQFGGDNCDKKTCTQSSHGCGFGWFFKCDGLCDDVPEPLDQISKLYH